MSKNEAGTETNVEHLTKQLASSWLLQAHEELLYDGHTQTHTHTHLVIHRAATHQLFIKHCLMYHESIKLSGVPVPVWPQG